MPQREIVLLAPNDYWKFAHELAGNPEFILEDPQYQSWPMIKMDNDTPRLPANDLVGLITRIEVIACNRHLQAGGAVPEQ